ncbi:MAG TPA: Gfo/Idh/MocA family oxidoreductase [Gaiellaceae bacterium]|nr:Gfo/Idh/MocA family oxidoreductase [Gaiellaceae bacterium]
MEGPTATYRKARTKRGEGRFSGDYRVVAALGTLEGSRRRAVALACRVPPAAQYLVVHDALVREVPDPFSVEDFERVSARLAEDATALEVLGNQTYLYSGEAPPLALTEILESALRAAEGGREPSSGRAASVIRVPEAAGSAAEPIARLRPPEDGQRIPVALLGAGDYARTQVIPALRSNRLAKAVVADREPQIAAFVAKEAGFAAATSDASLALEELSAPGIVIVATAHDSHARLAAAALERGHRVFLEKPTVVTESDVDVLLGALTGGARGLAVGFNRRFNPLVRRARSLLESRDGPLTITCIVREVSLEPSHWYLWPNQGTRVAGNLCHWIDLGVYLMGARALPVSATVTPRVGDDRQALDEERTFAFTFDDGSVLTIVATARGDDIRGVQEHIEARKGDLTLRLDDLWRLDVLALGRMRRHRTVWRDKGHARMFRDSIAAFLQGRPGSYPLRDLVLGAAMQLTATRLVQVDETSAAVGPALHEWLARLDRAVASEPRHELALA